MGGGECRGGGECGGGGAECVGGGAERGEHNLVYLPCLVADPLSILIN